MDIQTLDNSYVTPPLHTDILIVPNIIARPNSEFLKGEIDNAQNNYTT